MLYCSLRRCLWTLTPGCGLWWCQCLDLSQTPLRLTSGCSLQSCKHNLWSEWFMILHQAWVWFLSLKPNYHDSTEKFRGTECLFFAASDISTVNREPLYPLSVLAFLLLFIIYDDKTDLIAKINIFLLPVLWIVWNIFLLLLFALLLLFIRLHWMRKNWTQ